MKKYAFEVYVKGRVNIVVEAEDEETARDIAWDSPDFPALDKIYDSEIELIGEIDG